MNFTKFVVTLIYVRIIRIYHTKYFKQNSNKKSNFRAKKLIYDKERLIKDTVNNALYL